MRPLSCFLPGLLCAGLTVHAQPPPTPMDVLQPERNVRLEYAEVLRVEPVPLSAPADKHTGNCVAPEGEPAQQAPRTPPKQQDTNAGLTLSLHSGRAQEHPPTPRTTPAQCAVLHPSGTQTLPLYDVDYVLRGVKYRSRLPYDPGNRLQVQISVTPVLVPEQPGLEPPDS